MFRLIRLGVVAQQFNDAFLLRQRHASLYQTLGPLPQHDPATGGRLRPGRSGCAPAPGHQGRDGGLGGLLAQHPVQAAAARRLRAERLEVVEAQDRPDVDQARSGGDGGGHLVSGHGDRRRGGGAGDAGVLVEIGATAERRYTR